MTPEEVPDDLVAAARRADLEGRPAQHSWTATSDSQTRRLIAGAVTAERERIAQMADRNEAICTGSEGTSCYFSALIREDVR